MAKHLNDIFCYERGNKIVVAFKDRDQEQVNVLARQIASDLADFVSEKKWNNIDLEVDPASATVGGEISLPVLEIGIRPKSQVSNAMELIDAISDVEDMIDAAIHEIEDFDGIYVSLRSI